MAHQDLTSLEREVLERLLGNAPDAPEALAGLNEASRGRFLKTLANAAAASTERPADAPQSTNPPPASLVDRVWAPTVSVGDKEVPIIPSSVAIELVILADPDHGDAADPARGDTGERR